MRRRTSIDADVAACLDALNAAAPGSAAASSLARRIKTDQLYRQGAVRKTLLGHVDPAFVRLGREAEFLCAIEDELLAEIKAISAGFDTAGSEFIHTILALEILQRKRLRLPECPALPLPTEAIDIDEEHYRSTFDEVAGWDYFLEYFGIVLKSQLRGHKALARTSSIDPDLVVRAAAHFSQSSRWEIFHAFRSFWECGELAIDTEALLLDASDSELVRAFRISLSRVRAFRISRANDPLLDQLVVPGTRDLPLAACRSKEELVSCHLAALQFFSAELKEVVHGASLAEWIRAYHVLRDFAWTILQDVAPEQPGQLLVEREPAFFEKLLATEGGIDKRRAAVIVKHLTFNGTSNDLLDCPLVPVDGKLLMLPAVTAILEPAHSLESLLHSIRADKNHEVQFIGPGLEASVRASLREAGVLARKIEHNTYDCDVAFILDDVLFLCECKGKFVTADFVTYARWEQALRTDVVQQHRRTCDYFAANLHLVRQKLKRPPQWRPKAIERIIITSTKLGRPIHAEGYWITDHHTVHAYVTRRAATVMLGADEQFRLADARLEGPLRADGFLDYLGDPQVIAAHRDCLKQRSMPLEVAGRTLSFNDCETYGEIQFVEPA